MERRDHLRQMMDPRELELSGAAAVSAVSSPDDGGANCVGDVEGSDRQKHGEGSSTHAGTVAQSQSLPYGPEADSSKKRKHDTARDDVSSSSRAQSAL
eukprot:COSAG02_NODE_1601_length_11741_cov_40.329411_7_plen_98_part_00